MSAPADELAARKLTEADTRRPRLVDSPLRAERRKRRLTLGDVAGAVGVSLGYLSQVETGKNTPSLAVARRLATFFGVTVDSLFPAELTEVG